MLFFFKIYGIANRQNLILLQLIFIYGVPWKTKHLDLNR